MTIQDKAQHFFFDNKMTIKGTEYLYRDDFFTFVSSLEGIVEAKDASTSDGAASSKTAPAPASAKQWEGSESYWKKRCEAAEILIPVTFHPTDENEEDLFKSWQQLKSSIGEETEGQDG